MHPIHHTMSVYVVNPTAKQNVSCNVDSMIDGEGDLYCYRMNIHKPVHIGINYRPWQQWKHRVWVQSVKGTPGAAWCSNTCKLKRVAGIYRTRVVTCCDSIHMLCTSVWWSSMAMFTSLSYSCTCLCATRWHRLCSPMQLLVASQSLEKLQWTKGKWPSLLTLVCEFICSNWYGPLTFRYRYYVLQCGKSHLFLPITHLLYVCQAYTLSHILQQILRWPGSVKAFRKVPTYLLYNEHGQVMAWGLKAKNPSPIPGTYCCKWWVS